MEGKRSGNFHSVLKRNRRVYFRECMRCLISVVLAFVLLLAQVEHVVDVIIFLLPEIAFIDGKVLRRSINAPVFCHVPRSQIVHSR